MKKQKTGGAWYLLLQCSACQNIRGYRAPKTNKAQTCKACGAQIPLLNLKPVFAKCECGFVFHYRTNFTHNLEEFSCIHCGRPITLQLNRNGGYTAI